MTDPRLTRLLAIREHLTTVQGSPDWADVVEILDWYQRDVGDLLELVRTWRPEPSVDVAALRALIDGLQGAAHRLRDTSMGADVAMADCMLLIRNKVAAALLPDEKEPTL